MYFTSFVQISSSECVRLFTNPTFGSNLTELNFYLSDQVTDEVLDCLASATSQLQRIAIVECQNVTDQGIVYVTLGQRTLKMLELRNLRSITSEALRYVSSPHLSGVDLSGCTHLTSDGIFYLVHQNPSIRCLYLNHCRALDDQALYDIAQCIGENLHILELDFLPNMLDPATTLHKLSQRCPKISQLSLCNFFDVSFLHLACFYVKIFSLQNLVMMRGYLSIVSKETLSITLISVAIIFKPFPTFRQAFERLDFPLQAQKTFQI